jgi:hypothetical protein
MGSRIKNLSGVIFHGYTCGPGGIAKATGNTGTSEEERIIVSSQVTEW